jgi:hypothetical protein
MFNVFRNILIVSLFMTASGFVLSEMLLAFVLPLLSVRALVFALSALVCWLLLDNVTLAQDLAHATASTSTDGERHLLRSLLFASRRRALTHSQLEEEIASHRATALQLDLLSEQSNRARITALHWSLLASKSIVVSNLERMQNDRRLTRSSSWDCAFKSI